MEQQPSTVIDFFSRKPYSGNCSKKVMRISPDFDNLEILYSNAAKPEKLFSMKILFWAITASGEVSAMTPWLYNIINCCQISAPLHCRWEGYYDAQLGKMFFSPPKHKQLELEAALDYCAFDSHKNALNIVQELPDHIGTHAIFTQEKKHKFSLHEILSWRLLSNGALQAMVVDDKKITTTPVLPGDKCLYPAQEQDNFRYFFHHRIANKIKANDPATLAAFDLLVTR